MHWVVIALNSLVLIGLVWRLWPYLRSRVAEVYLNGQRMREGTNEDYVWENDLPKFNFRLRDRGGVAPDVVVIRGVALTPEVELLAKLKVVGEDDDGEPITRVVLEEYRQS